MPLYSPTRNHELLQRSELVALFNTLHRFSESLHAINLFRDMMLQAADAPPTSAVSSTFFVICVFLLISQFFARIPNLLQDPWFLCAVRASKHGCRLWLIFSGN